ncbi:SDR family oxidoreductase [Patescibacteria group bacterium]|nr:SDR family oxidoreductase [Patescibacteria group bacterium]MBU1890014.1 SDR family oxidoreductase [Patescibacteria group bacterium]
MKETERLLENKIAVVTGASSGIGKAIALRFSSEGARVIVSSRNLSRCEEVVEKIQRDNNVGVAISCDVRKEEDVKGLFDQAVSEYGGIDIVIANAGISGGSKMIEEHTIEEWNQVMETNLTGVFLTAREAYRRMKKCGGHLILMSSQAGVEGYAKKGLYCATKFGVRGLGHAMAEEGREHKIIVSTICPGTVDTPILAASNTKVKHPMSPDAIADAAVYLARQRGNSMVRDLIVERMNLG